MTWFITDDGYELFFNRDEAKTRKRAFLPDVKKQNNVIYISPTDADAGGTWIAANEHGITVCLLNHYEFEKPSTEHSWTSRGEIVKTLSEAVDLDGLQQLFKKLALKQFRAFRLFAINRLGQNLFYTWDGNSLKLEQDIQQPKSSSYFQTDEVIEARQRLFNALELNNRQDRQAYLDYHASHSPRKSAFSVCMHRDDAGTVSCSHVVVNSKQVEFSYTDGAPCEVAFSKAITIDLSKELSSVA